MKLSGSKQPPVGDDSLEGSSLNVVMLGYDEISKTGKGMCRGWKCGGSSWRIAEDNDDKSRWCFGLFRPRIA